jgi:hypothetical protein
MVPQRGLAARFLSTVTQPGLDSEERSMRGPVAGVRLAAGSVLVVTGPGDASPPGPASVVSLESPLEIGCRAWQQT